MEETRLIGKYRIVREISRSSITSVYEALQPPLDRKVLIKRLHPEYISDREISARFEREARTLGLIKHQNIVHIYDYHASEDDLYLVEEWISGGSVADLLKEHGTLTEPETVAIALDVLEGLEVAHKAGIIHRDIKPSNLLISHEGVVKITDFGLSQFEGSPGLTQQGMVIGTPAYMAPEVVSTGQADARSDLYSLGVTLYELMTGENPFLTKNLSETLTKVLSFKPAPLEGVSPKMQKLLASMLDKKEEKRPASVTEALEQIRELAKTFQVEHGWRDVKLTATPDLAMREESGSGIRPRVKPKRTIKVVFTALTVIIMCVFAFIIYNNISNRSENNISTTEKRGEPSESPILSPVYPREDSIHQQDVNNQAVSIHPDQDMNMSDRSNLLDKTNSDIGSKSSKEIDSLDQRSYTAVRNLLTPESSEAPSRERESAEPWSASGQLEKRVGYLMLSVEPWANVFFENRFMAQTPYISPLELPSGEVTLTLVNPDFPPLTRTFIIPSGDTLHERVNLLSLVGIIDFIDAYPWAEVYLDGDYLGRTPIGKRLYLPLGEHKISFRHPNFPEHIEKLKVDKNFSLRSLNVDLTR